MKTLIFTILFLIIIGGAAYIIYENLPGELKNFDFDYNFKTEIPTDISAKSTITQFVPNMRFNHNELTYSFTPTCTLNDKQDMKEAFSIIQTRTEILSFQEISNKNNSDIEITCSEDEFKSSKNIFIAGEGGPTEYYNSTIYPIILKGTIKLYKPQYETEKCNEPLVELHELLHVFGFEHYNKTDSIMYPYLSCNQKLNQEYVEYLKQLYSIKPKAELQFEKITATKSGRYLDFNISVSNLGILDATNVQLIISSNNEKIKTFELGDIDLAITKTLTSQNIKLPLRNTENIQFKITTPTEEYNQENNIIDLEVKE